MIDPVLPATVTSFHAQTPLAALAPLVPPDTVPALVKVTLVRASRPDAVFTLLDVVAAMLP